MYDGFKAESGKITRYELTNTRQRKVKIVNEHDFNTKRDSLAQLLIVSENEVNAF